MVALLVVMEEAVSPVGVPHEDPAVMVKLALEISKKILLTASILMRAVEVGVLGIKTACDPSFGVLDTSTVGKVCPPSVLNEIFTLAQLTGVAVVLATFHVMFCVLPPVQDIAVFGAVT